MTNGVYSEFECDAQNIKFKGDEAAAAAINCIGTVKESSETKTITKKCRGVVTKSKTKIIAMGLEESVHCPYDIYKKMLAMNDDDLIEGVSGVSSTAKFPTFGLTQKILDEDDVVKYKFYPCCTLTEKPEGNIDNAAEEVAEITLKIECAADEYGFFCYEALEEELTVEAKAAWMNSFDSDFYHKEQIA